MNENKRIAVNTIILYGKLIITTIIGLISSRYVLTALGSDDFGLYSVVGGIVALMNVLGTTMVSTSYRFLSVELGKGVNGNVQKVYSTVFLVHIILALLLIFIGETLGIYYVNNILVLDDPTKLADARFVLHTSIFTTVLTIINVPANGLTVAREKFLFTSIVEILCSIIKIILVVWLVGYLGNRLRLYSLIMALLSVITFISYQWYCYKNDRHTIRYRFNPDKSDYKSIIKYSSWSLLGATACIGNTQGAAMIINAFFSTVVNAAFGIATQVNSYALVFVKSISQAAVPQIMKSYGADNTERSVKLVYVISRFSSLALLIVLVPLLIFTDELLVLWLGNPPEYTRMFVTFLLINTFFSVIAAGFDPCIQSTGNIKSNELFFSFIYLFQLPIIYLLYRIGLPVYINVILLTIGTIIIKVYQMFLLSRITVFKIKTYCTETAIPVILTMLIAFVPLVLKLCCDFSMTGNIILFFLTVLWVFVVIYFVGLKSNERELIVNFFKSILRKL